MSGEQRNRPSVLASLDVSFYAIYGINRLLIINDICGNLNTGDFVQKQRAGSVFVLFVDHVDG